MPQPTSAKDPDEIFARIAIESRYITEWHLKKAQERQTAYRHKGLSKRLAEALEELGYITAAQRAALENAHRYRDVRDRSKHFARICVKSRYATQQECEAGLTEQKRRYTESGQVPDLGDILVQLGHLSKEQLMAARKILAIKEEQRAKRG